MDWNQLLCNILLIIAKLAKFMIIVAYDTIIILLRLIYHIMKYIVTMYLKKPNTTNIIINNNNNHSNKKKSFKSFSNDGCIEGYCNQCFWISILQYLKLQRNIDINIEEFHMTASNMYQININNLKSNFDYECHADAAVNLAKIYNLKIEIYYANYTEKTRWINIGNPAYIFGKGKNVVRIVAFGNHFELIKKVLD